MNQHPTNDRRTIYLEMPMSGINEAVLCKAFDNCSIGEFDERSPALVLVDRGGLRRDFLIIRRPYHRLATPVLPPICTAPVSVPVQNQPNWEMTVSPNQSKPTECVEIQLYGSVGWQSVVLLTWRLPAPRVTAFRNPEAGLMRHRWGRFSLDKFAGCTASRWL